MRVFVIQAEAGNGFMRPAKEGESLSDFVAETITDKESLNDLTYGQLEPDEDDPDYVPDPMDPQPSDEPEGAQEAFYDDNYCICWYAMEVPDDTRYIVSGAPTINLDGYVGISGEGYVEMEES